jgi:hypothetical protein
MVFEILATTGEQNDGFFVSKPSGQYRMISDLELATDHDVLGQEPPGPVVGVLAAGLCNILTPINHQ